MSVGEFYYHSGDEWLFPSDQGRAIWIGLPDDRRTPCCVAGSFGPQRSVPHRGRELTLAITAAPSHTMYICAGCLRAIADDLDQRNKALTERALDEAIQKNRKALADAARAPKRTRSWIARMFRGR